MRRHALSTLDQWRRVRAIRADIRATRTQAEQLTAGSNDLARDLAACRAEIAALRARLDEMGSTATRNQERVMHALRVVRDGDAGAWDALWKLRRTDEYRRAFEEDEPLVTIIVTTYRNWPLLRERCLASLLDQTYERFEAIVVGDAAPPEAEEVVNSFGDERLRFVNLPYRGPYPGVRALAHAQTVSGTLVARCLVRLFAS